MVLKFSCTRSLLIAPPSINSNVHFGPRLYRVLPGTLRYLYVLFMSYLDVLPPSYLPFTSTTWYLRTSQYFHTTFVPNTCPRFVYARIIQLGFQFPPRFAGCVPAVPYSLPRQQSSAIVRGLGQFSTDSIESEVGKHQNDQFQFSCVLAHMVSIKVH